MIAISRPAQRRQWKKRLPLIVMTAIFAGFLVGAIHALVTSKISFSNDFYERWRAAEIFWVEHANPYSKLASVEIEIGLYGAPADPAKGQYRGDSLYPFYDYILLAPLVTLPFEWVEAFWMVLVGALCAGVFLASASVFGWKLRSWLLVVGIIWAVIFFYPSGRGVLLGQIGTVGACLEVIAVWALIKRHDALAGVILALATVKPPVGILVVPFLLLYGLRFARWRFVSAFNITFGVMMGASFVLLPSWFGDWLGQVFGYHDFTLVVSSIWVITTNVLPGIGRLIEIVLSLAVIVLLLWAWWRVLWRRDEAMFTWTIALTFTASNLVVPPTATPHFVVFLFILVFYFKQAAKRPRGGLMVLALMLVVTVVLWGLFLATVDVHAENVVNYLPLPVASLILLVTTRRWWIGSDARPNVTSVSASMETR